MITCLAKVRLLRKTQTIFSRIACNKFAELQNLLQLNIGTHFSEIKLGAKWCLKEIGMLLLKI